MPGGAAKSLWDRPWVSIFARAVLAVLPGLLLCLPGPGAAQGPAAAPSVDQGVHASADTAQSLPRKQIRYAYTEGDFDRVVAAIDSFTRTRKAFGRSDSAFIAKYLAVIYTANPLTREMGKHYMVRLLSLEPSARIVDMFASEEINRVFESVREELIVRRETLAQEESAPRRSAVTQSADTRSGKTPSPPGIRKKRGFPASYYWIAGGLAAAALGGAAIYLLQPDEPGDKTYELP
jgi:hypothetical protein